MACAIKAFCHRGLQKYGLKLLIGIRRVLNRHREGFDWKEIAARLHVGGTSLDDTFWREIRHADSSEKALQYGSAGSEEANLPEQFESSQSGKSPVGHAFPGVSGN